MTKPVIKSHITLAEALQFGVKQLSDSKSAKLDSEILLLKVLNDNSALSDAKPKTKTWLFTWPENTLTAEQFQQFSHYLNKRSEGMPIAYITGKKDFWTLTLAVTSDTLIPRPETELLVECALEKISPAGKLKLLDLGTGSGAIALAIASERNNIDILATDISEAALKVAQKNAATQQLSNVSFCLSHWFDAIPKQTFDLIVSNPPYIAEHDLFLEENVKKYEPLSALHSAAEGLSDISQIISQCRNYLKPGGWLLFEHGYDQAQAVQSLLKKSEFTQIATIKDLNHLPRVTLAHMPASCPK